jgi:hypothetical protein
MASAHAMQPRFVSSTPSKYGKCAPLTMLEPRPELPGAATLLHGFRGLERKVSTWAALCMPLIQPEKRVYIFVDLLPNTVYVASAEQQGAK